MSVKHRIREDRLVVYSRHLEKPEDWLHFVHFPYFMARWNESGFDDDDLRALETLIMANPRRAPVVKGTGGLRKMRFSRSDGNRGKRGGARIGYAYIQEFDAVGTFAVYTKNQQDNLTNEQKRLITQGIQRFKQWLSETEKGRREVD